MSAFTVILDYSNLWHMARYAAIAAGPGYDLLDTTAVNLSGKVRTVLRAVDRLGITDYDLFFAEDREATRKLEAYPMYKGTRENLSCAKEHGKNAIRENGQPGYWCHSEGNEADDVMATLVQRSTARGVPCLIVSADRDMWQLIGASCSVWNPMERRKIEPLDVFNAFQLHRPEHIPLYKALWGDSGDCVPNAVPRMQKHLLPVIQATTVGNLDDFKSRLTSRWSSLTPRCRELYRAGEAQVHINWSLVKLDKDCKLEFG